MSLCKQFGTSKSVGLGLVAAGLLATMTGCGDPILERQVVTRLRALGARYEADDDSGRASPLAGESGRVRWLLAGPDGPVEVRFDLFACVSRDRVHGVPSCAGEPVAESQGQGSEPLVEISVPSAERLLVAGGFCTEGDVLWTPELSGSKCSESAAEGEIATYELEVVDDLERAHRHPDLSEAELRRNGEPWESDESSCVPAGESHVLQLKLPATARDPRPPEDPTGEWETIQVSHLSTQGRFERPFTVIAADEADLDVNVTWQAPESPGTAHLYFVVRDLRGGVSWLSRQVCIE